MNEAMNEPIDSTEEYNAGWNAGYHGKPLDIKRAKACPSYDYGWQDGNADRPSLEELTLDYQTELNDPFGY